MRPFLPCLVLATLSALPAASPVPVMAESSNAPEFKDVYDVIRAHLAGANDTQLNRAAVDGLLAQLGPKVSLVGNESADGDSTNSTLLAKSTTFDDGILYLQIARVDHGLSKEIGSLYDQTSATNHLKGMILDLRYAGGANYNAAASTADLFLNKAEPLLDWGKGVVSSEEKTNAIPIAVAVLVNGKTSQAAEALAATIREAGIGLILGSRTAGNAMVTQDFDLKNGGQLRIATSPVKLGNGEEISPKGVQPDIEVAVNAAKERRYFEDPYADLEKTNSRSASVASAGSSGSTNSSSRHVPFNEAELVREHKLGLDPDADPDEISLPLRTTPEAPVVRDPVLARSLDLLKGLAVVRQSRR